MARDEAVPRDVPHVEGVPHASPDRPARGDLLTVAAAALRAALPPTWRLEVRRVALRRTTEPHEDARVLLEGPDGARATLGVLLVDPEPRDIPRLADRARALSHENALLVAPFLGPRARGRLAEERQSYVDATGNLRITLDRPALFVERAGGDRDPYPRPRRLGSLRGPAAARVTRALLDLRPPHGVRELATRAGVPPASAARALDLLDREGIVTRDARGRVVDVEWRPLLERWAADRGPGRAFRRLELAVAGPLAAGDALRLLASGYAVTGAFAATGSAHGALVAYVPDAGAVAAALGLSPTPAGGLVLVEPDDPVAFERAQPRFGLVCAALSQVAADLLAERSPLAERLLGWMAANEHAWRR